MECIKLIISKSVYKYNNFWWNTCLTVCSNSSRCSFLIYVSDLFRFRLKKHLLYCASWEKIWTIHNYYWFVVFFVFLIITRQSMPNWELIGYKNKVVYHIYSGYKLGPSIHKLDNIIISTEMQKPESAQNKYKMCRVQIFVSRLINTFVNPFGAFLTFLAMAQHSLWMRCTFGNPFNWRKWPDLS